MPPAVRRPEPPDRASRKRITRQARPVELLACGDPRTHDEHEILLAACGTRVCDRHPTFQHACRIAKHNNPGHDPQRGDKGV